MSEDSGAESHRALDIPLDQVNENFVSSFDKSMTNNAMKTAVASSTTRLNVSAFRHPVGVLPPDFAAFPPNTAIRPDPCRWSP